LATVSWGRIWIAVSTDDGDDDDRGFVFPPLPQARNGARMSGSERARKDGRRLGARVTNKGGEKMGRGQ